MFELDVRYSGGELFVKAVRAVHKLGMLLLANADDPLGPKVESVDEVDVNAEFERDGFSEQELATQPSGWSSSGYNVESLTYCVAPVSPPAPPSPADPPVPPASPPDPPASPPAQAPPDGCRVGGGDGYNYDRYEGGVSVTETGKTCQYWSEVSPHVHTYTTTSEWPYVGQPEHNYCRNPGKAGWATATRSNGIEERPWCFTTESDTRWEYCNIPLCNYPSPPATPPRPPFAPFNCENPPEYAGECPNYYGCKSSAYNPPCNCLEYCSYDSKCCHASPSAPPPSASPSPPPSASTCTQTQLVSKCKNVPKDEDECNASYRFKWGVAHGCHWHKNKRCKDDKEPLECTLDIHLDVCPVNSFGIDVKTGYNFDTRESSHEPDCPTAADIMQTDASERWAVWDSYPEPSRCRLDKSECGTNAPCTVLPLPGRVTSSTATPSGPTAAEATEQATEGFCRKKCDATAKGNKCQKSLCRFCENSCKAPCVADATGKGPNDDGFNGCVNAEDVCAGLSISKRKKMCRRKKGKGLLTCFALCSPTCQSATEATNVFEWGPGAELSWD